MPNAALALVKKMIRALKNSAEDDRGTGAQWRYRLVEPHDGRHAGLIEINIIGADALLVLAGTSAHQKTSDPLP